jgi:hypothetical protein
MIKLEKTKNSLSDEPFDAIIQQYPSERLVVEVTEENEFDEPIRGILLGHVPTIQTAFQIEKRHSGGPTAVFCVLYIFRIRMRRGKT